MATRRTKRTQDPGRQDQALSGQDQTGSDQDQSDAERDQAASDRDQQSADRGHAVSDDALAGPGDEVAREQGREIHGATKRARQRSSRSRAETALRRDITASERDAVAAQRDAAAAERDRAAEARDRQAEADERALDRREELDSTSDEGTGELIVLRAARQRRDAREIRARAAAQRLAAAQERERAARDREHAQRDREEAAAERVRASLDELTGTLRRGVGLQALEREIERARRAEDALAVAFLNVDGLRGVNDGAGPDAGDRALEAVADQTGAHLRPDDLLIRFGGAEFLCAVPGARADALPPTFEAIAQDLAADPDGAPISVGFAELAPGDSLHDLIERAYARLSETRRQRRAADHRIGEQGLASVPTTAASAARGAEI